MSKIIGFILLFSIFLICNAHNITPHTSEKTEGREFSCKERVSNVTKESEALIISGSTLKENLAHNWPEFRNDKTKTTGIEIAHCTLPENDSLDNFEVFKMLRWLVLFDMDLPEFNLEFVANNPRLRVLILDNNPIERLLGDAQISLEYLSLINTSLTTFPKSTLHIMSQLKSLHISGERFSGSHEEACKQFKQLEKFNGMPCLPDNATSAPTVVTGENKQSFGNILRPMGRLGLSLSVIMIMVIGSSSTRWTCLMVFAACTQLSTEAMAIDPFLSNATVLHMESREISTLSDDAFASLPNLTYLYLSNNSLSRLNVHSASLTYLKIENNQLRSIQNDDFKGLPHLEKLHLAGNLFKEVNWNMDINTGNIRKVDLSRNRALRSVRIKSQLLEVLSLAGNTIDRLELDTPKLTLIDLRNAYFSDGGFEAICRRHSRFSFSISYVREDNATADYFECKADKAQMVMYVAAVEPQLKLVGCEFTTLRAEVGDVVISMDMYLMLKVTFAVMCTFVIVMCLTLIWLTIKVLNFNKREKLCRQKRLVSGCSA